MRRKNSLLLRRALLLIVMSSTFTVYFLETSSNLFGFNKKSQSSLLDERIHFNKPVLSGISDERNIKLDPMVTWKTSHSEITTIRKTVNNTLNKDSDDKINTQILGCEKLKLLLEKAKSSILTTFRKENKYGSRGIYFSEISETYAKKPIVIKVATMKNQSDAVEAYRYNSALRELRNLQKLHALEFQGAPQIWGSCVSPDHVIYAVTRFVEPQSLCLGNGTDMRCAMAHDVLQVISKRKDPDLSSLIFLEKVTCFFAQFEKHGIFMEDFSGANFYFSPKTLDFYLVDADSIIFYGNAPLLSRLSCHKDADCPRPSGNLWPAHALNRKIYYGCGEMYGICRNNTCRGISSSLHTCGIGRWLVTAMRSIVPVRVYNDFRVIKDCLSATNPTKRCTMEYSCNATRSLLKKYHETSGKT